MEEETNGLVPGLAQATAVDLSPHDKDTVKQSLQIREPVTAEQATEFFTTLDDGLSVSEAASRAGFNKRTGYRLLQRYEANLDGVQKLLAAKAYQAAEDWIRASGNAATKGDHKPAKDLLETVGAIEPSQANGHGGITIVIGTPDKPIPAQILDVSPPTKAG